ncbi:MAG: RNA pseudouridine synthase [Bacillota bacterium]|nr:RNA pseudouridine synthase [Bacillota bacterium]
MEAVYKDKNFIVCIKPAGVLSTDEAGGMPSLVREYLGDEKACVRTVHRLDQVVSGLMVLARNPETASELSRQIRDDEFGKSYLAVVHGILPEKEGRMTDLLLRSKEERKTYVVTETGKNVQEAILEYEVLKETPSLSLVKINLITGRTHQIRCQFSSRGLPLVGDRKYSTLEDGCDIALWSYSISFTNPTDGRQVEFKHKPPETYPWTEFDIKHMAIY